MTIRRLPRGLIPGGDRILAEIERLGRLNAIPPLHVIQNATGYTLRLDPYGLEIAEADGTPDYTGITKLVVNQATGLQLSQPAANQAQLDLLSQMSLTADASGIKLVNDSASPGNTKLYGTDGSGAKGWYDQPSGGGSGTVTHTGNLTASSIVLGNGTADIKVVAGITTDGVSQINLGVTAVSVGILQIFNATSGSVTISPPTGALGSIAVTWPNASSILPVISQQLTFSGPSTARTYTLPDAAVTLAGLSVIQTWTGAQTFADSKLQLSGATSGTVILKAPATGGGTLTLPGGTDTIAGLAASQAFTNKTYNGMTLTASTGTFTLANSKTLTVNNTLTLTATDGSTLAIGAGGTLGSAAYLTAGTAANNVVQLDGSSKLPAVDGSALTNLPGANTLTHNTGSTTNAFVTVFDITNASGLHAVVAIKNTHASNQLVYRWTTKDMYGTTSVGGSQLLAAANTITGFNTYSSVAVAGVPGPFQELKLEVMDSSAGNHATYDCYRSVVG